MTAQLLLLMCILRTCVYLYSQLLCFYRVKELQRNSYIKDAMRQQCVLKLVDSWYQIVVCIILAICNTIVAPLTTHK